VEHFGRLGLQRFRREFLGRQPFLWKRPALAEGWKWAPEELLRRLKESGEDDVTEVLEPRVGNLVSETHSARRKTNVRNALEEMLSLPPRLCQMRVNPALFWREHELLPEIMQSAEFVIDLEESFLLVTAGGLRTPMHSDEQDSFLFHLSGAKKAVVVEPSDGDKALLRFRRISGTHGELFGAEMNGAFHRFCLDEGDLLFIPKRWLHDVESATLTASLSIRFTVR